MGPAECVVWWAEPDPDAVARAWFDAAERARYERYRRPADRARFATARALARRVLAARLDVAPGEVRFDTTCRLCGCDRGKPRVVRGPSRLDFSISHAGERVVLAVVEGAEVGVDVERIATVAGILSSAELAAQGRLPARSRAVDAITRWTRKEALLKVYGLGLTVDPRRLTVSGAGEPPRLLEWPDPPEAARAAGVPGRLAAIDPDGGHPHHGQDAVRMYDLAPGVGYAATVALRGPGPDTVRERWVDAVSLPGGAAPDRSDAGAADGQ
ncbi:4'-phosphopantetheinyl transferase family protein [Embleya scabrispora]|uniref:4'-phosphopantetheinyl transferase family protein n=1 Tax=Embleya scabrispora TaxID=159449 RepID=UPI00137533F2|nr:4'-phosphopantetheinyl transferase superfamily protein [Embleya scabrispora]